MHNQHFYRQELSFVLGKRQIVQIFLQSVVITKVNLDHTGKTKISLTLILIIYKIPDITLIL